ncbi:MAG: fibronectin type III domain-containing protein [Desulfobacteraceae bacterium]|nr:fibronectin type III domain-containing protein [Desulfobacteraceae bacterium]MBC2754800.1 fibronectin type III domain-containing protein [Desulfobacteraceae bacterium]
MSFSVLTVHSADVVLIWDRPNDSRVTGYKIFYGPADTSFKSAPKESIHSPDHTSCDIFGLKVGQTYGFAAKSFDKHGNESVFSEVLYYDILEMQDESSSDRGGGSAQDKNSNGGGGCFIRVVSDLNAWD